ncbi:MAG TPA: hypothetical protein VFA45_15285 [Actinomycetes bacterium]|nr:hypothetical protein [Actinomycetes bacterium]
MLVAPLSRALIATLGLVTAPQAATATPATPTPTAPPPPCWCGGSASDHPSAADHDYAPAWGTESEAHDAW